MPCCAAAEPCARRLDVASRAAATGSIRPGSSARPGVRPSSRRTGASTLDSGSPGRLIRSPLPKTRHPHQLGRMVGRVMFADTITVGWIAPARLRLCGIAGRRRHTIQILPVRAGRAGAWDARADLRGRQGVRPGTAAPWHDRSRHCDQRINPREGVLELTFHVEAPETETFHRSVEPNEIHWKSTNGGSRFWRPRYGEFSDAAVTLQRDGDCGPIYRSLRIAFHDDASTDRISTFLSGIMISPSCPCRSGTRTIVRGPGA